MDALDMRYINLLILRQFVWGGWWVYAINLNGPYWFMIGYNTKKNPLTQISLTQWMLLS